MYKAYLNDECFYNDSWEEKYISNLKLTLEENKAGSFEFTLYSDHPYYSAFEKLNGIVVVKQNDKIIFRGRVLTSEESFFKDRKITCEGEYAFFNDGIFYPLGSEPVDDEDNPKAGTAYTPIEIFTQILTDYNSQVPDERKFIIGNITIDKSTEEISYWNLEFKKTIDALDELLEQCGGHFVFRHEEEGVYLDWTKEYELINQEVEYGKNLLDLTQTIQGDEVITGILPHGDTNENTNLPTNLSTISIPTTDLHMQMGEVPKGVDNSRSEQFGEYGIYLVNIPLYEKYGLILEERSYDGYPADWKDQLIADVDNLTGLTASIEVSAVDLAWLNDVDFFQLGKAVKVVANGINDTYNITKLQINLTNPSDNKFTLGKVIPNFIEQVIQGDKVKPVDGQSIKIIGYEYAYAVSDSGTVQPDDDLFSTAVLPVQGKWLWTRVTTRYNDGKETKAYYPSYQGQDAKAFRIIADSTVVVRNDRRSDAQAITFRAEISGYPDTTPLWYINGQKVGEGGTYSRSVAYKDAEAFSINLYNGTVLMDTLNLTIIDKTGGALYLGACNNAVPTQTPEGESLIKGDYFLAVETFDEFIAGEPYIWNGTKFIAVSLNSNVTPNEYGEIMSNALSDAVESETVENSKFFSWFKKLATNEAFAKYFVAHNFHVAKGNFEFNVRTIDDEGEELEYPVWEIKYAEQIIFQIDAENGIITSNANNFQIKPDGTIVAKNADISGTANIYDGQFNGYFDCTSIKTSPEASKVFDTFEFIASDNNQPESFYEQKKYLYTYKSVVSETEYTSFILCKISGYEKVAFLKGYQVKYQVLGWQSFVIFYDSNKIPLKLSDIGIPYSTSGRYFNLDSFYSNYGVSPRDCIFCNSQNYTRITQNLSIEMYSGGNKLILNIPGIEGGGVPSSEIDTYEKGRAYIDSSGSVRVKL